MKKLKTSIALIAIFLNTTLSAEETGEAAVATAEAAIDNNWQNWTFAAVAMVLAAGAVYVVSLDSGHSVD